MLRLYNTLSGTTEPFSCDDGIVKMYVCGITPYAPAHVGHAMRGVVFDVLRRYLKYSGYEVKHVENVTDIDDKMIQGAAEQGTSTSELAERFTRLYLEEMGALNVLRADVYPRATHEIPGMVEMIEVLVDKGYAYPVDGDVYFRVRADESYGKLSHRTLDSMRAGARVEVEPGKEDPMDFALWKAKKPGEPAWDSPWGPGRPGWHIECSFMSKAHLGSTVDVHGGGQDLVFPHHENEIAQSEAYADGHPMARYWVHNGYVKLGEDKMSKSLGNYVTLGDALRQFSPDALRLFFLSSHYRSPLVYRDQDVAAQERAAERLRQAATVRGADGETPPLEGEAFRERFVSAMDDDLNTPRALSALFDLARETNRARDLGRDVSAAQETLRELAAVLGLTMEPAKGEMGGDVLPLIHLVAGTYSDLRSADLDDLAESMSDALEERGVRLGGFIGGLGATLKAEGDPAPADANAGDIMEALIEARAGLRKARRYDMADGVRDGLAEIGYLLEDTAQGTEWKRQGP